MEETFTFKNRQEYLKAIDSVLPDSYIQRRSVGGSTYTYIPAPIKEAVADHFFQYWNVVDETYAQMVNELVCTVKLVYQPAYPGADELYCTGSAAVPIQMDRGASVAKFPIGKKKNALEYNLPGVRIEAVSNALGSLGNIFGRSLSRKMGEQSLPTDFTMRKHEADESETES